MGILDFFNKNPREKGERGQSVLPSVTPIGNTSKGPVTVFKPENYSDVEKIIDCLKMGKTAIVHFTGVKPETAVRILDMLSGAVYALDGGVYEMEKNIFMFSPLGVEVY